jgi:acyl-CoA synthetase (AMP-forming)/AMP-acid ligase II
MQCTPCWLLIRKDQSTGYAATCFTHTPEMIIPPTFFARGSLLMFWDDLSKFGEKIALVENSVSISYRELYDRAETFSKELGSSKSLLLLGIDNTIDCIIAFYGALIGQHVVIFCDNNNEELRANLKRQFSPHAECFSCEGLRELVRLDNAIKSEQ